MNKEHLTKETAVIRHKAQKQALLDQLRRIPIIQVACEKSGVSRPTFYRMRAEDAEFKTTVEEALAEGVAFINDLSEAQLVAMIKDKNFQAINLWLRVHNKKYANKLELEARVKHESAALTQEQEALVEDALRRIVLPQQELKKGE